MVWTSWRCSRPIPLPIHVSLKAGLLINDSISCKQSISTALSSNNTPQLTTGPSTRAPDVSDRGGKLCTIEEHIVVSRVGHLHHGDFRRRSSTFLVEGDAAVSRDAAAFSLFREFVLTLLNIRLLDVIV